MKIELISECRAWGKLWSVRVMAVWSVLGAVIVSAWPVASWVLNQVLPDNPVWRALIAAATGLVTFGSLVAARLASQPKLKPDG